MFLHRLLPLIVIAAQCSAAFSPSRRQQLDLQPERQRRDTANDYGPPLHVSSSVLQLAHADEPPASLELLAAHAQDPWHASGLTSGYELWPEGIAEPPPSGVFSNRAQPVSALHTRVVAGASAEEPAIKLSDNGELHNAVVTSYGK